MLHTPSSIPFKIIFAFIILLLFIPVPSQAEHLTVARVYDGDTILCENRDISIMIRLAGIDAPEIAHNKKETGQPYSQQAKAVLAKLVLNKVVDVKGFGLDDYNRLLAVINLDGKNINLEMVEQGMAEVYQWKFPNGLDEAQYTAAEKRARSSSRGMWVQGNNYTSPAEWRKTH
jgi:micrococcal nuclease